MNIDRHSGKIKIYPSLGIAAINLKLGGAWRVWTFARYLNVDGSGHIERKNLRIELRALGVPDRDIRRWISQAICCKLFQKHEQRLYLAGMVKAHEVFNLDRISIPIFINISDFLKKGWRSLVWSAFLVTLKEKPISQKNKFEITGISPRVQRKFQGARPGSRRGNFAYTNLMPWQIEGMKEVQGGHYLVIHNKVIQRLPDTRIVPEELAQPTAYGRLRKYQKRLNARQNVGRASFIPHRLFHQSKDEIRSTEMNISKADILPWNLPTERFCLELVGTRNNFWQLVPVREISS